MRFAPDLSRMVEGLGLLAWVLIATGPSRAAPVVRYQVDQRGDMVLIGNTLGFDCRPGVPRPLLGSVGACGAHVESSEIDVLWRADDPVEGQARADRSITPEMARSTAVLRLPEGAVVSYARLYFAAGRPKGSPAGTQVLVSRPGRFSQVVQADGSIVLPDDGPGMLYQSSADVTALVQDHGPGPFRVERVDALSPVDLDRLNFAAWSMVVFYRRQEDTPRTLTLIEGMERVDSRTQVAMTLRDFVPARAGFSARLGVIAYEGDDNTAGDRIKLNGQDLSDAKNPAANFMNGTRSTLGAAVTVEGDLPRMSGEAGSMNGLDLDIVDVSALIGREASSASVLCTTSEDIYYAGTFVGSVATHEPVFTDTDLLYRNLTNPGGAVRPGDRIEYTFIVRNTGSDASLGTVLSNVLPQGTTYVPGSLRVTTGRGAGSKSDAPGDDEAEYDPLARTVTVRLGEGATSGQGGSIGAGAPPIVVKLQVMVDMESADRTISSQAVVRAAGEAAAMLGVPPTTFLSGDGTFPNRPTIFHVRECQSNLDCRPGAPICDRKGALPRCTSSCEGQGECTGAATGQLCLPTRVCGCLADGNCPSGRCEIARGTCIISKADLEVLLRLEPMRPRRGMPVAHVITVENRGPEAASGVTLIYAIPERAMIKEIAPGAGWTCMSEAGRILCTRAADLLPGQGTPEVRVLTQPPEEAAEFDVVAAARASASEDPDPSNNSVVRSVGLGADRLQLAGGGLGCSATGDAPLAHPLCLCAALAALLLRRRRRALIAALILVCGPFSEAARGQKQGYKVARHEPTSAGEWSFMVDHPWYSRTRYFAAGLTLDYAHEPLVLGRLTEDESFQYQQAVIEHQLLGHLDLAGSFLDRVTLSASLPLLLAERGQPAAGVVPQDGISVSDPRLGFIVRLYGQPSEGPFSVSLAAHFFIPLRKFAEGLSSQASDQEMRFLPKVILAGAHRHLLWSGTLAFLYRSEAVLGDLDYTSGSSVGPELQLGGRVYYADSKRRFAAGPEFLLASVITGGNFFKKDYTSLELLAGGHGHILRTITLGLAAGLGLLREPGTPDFRMLLRVGYAPGAGPGRAPRDRDRDGVPDEVDACPDEPGQRSDDPRTSGCPPPVDRDHDGILDRDDACPDKPGGERPDERRPGCPFVDRDRDGVADADDRCPDLPAGLHPDAARAGCPLPDRDGDSIVDERDACPDKPGAPSPDPKKNGCPGLVTITSGQIKLLKPVFFAVNRDVILRQSFPVLQAVASALLAEPAIRHLSIEGHTDNVGSAAYNTDLSRRRAQSVMRWLIQHGVGRERLSARGFGPAQPVDTNKTAAGRARNRRVEFRIGESE